MGCDGPEPPEINHNELDAPPNHDLITNGQDSDEEHDYFGYEPLALGPETVHSDRETDDETENASSGANLSSTEPMENVINRQAWNRPNILDSILMDNDRVQQIMTAMENVLLPDTSYPEWARAVSEEQWRQSLQTTIDRLRSSIMHYEINKFLLDYTDDEIERE